MVGGQVEHLKDNHLVLDNTLPPEVHRLFPLRFTRPGDSRAGFHPNIEGTFQVSGTKRLNSEVAPAVAPNLHLPGGSPVLLHQFEDVAAQEAHPLLECGQDNGNRTLILLLEGKDART